MLLSYDRHFKPLDRHVYGSQMSDCFHFVRVSLGHKLSSIDPESQTQMQCIVVVVTFIIPMRKFHSFNDFQNVFIQMQCT